MPAITASAPGKIILLGEHAVVYGRPAIASPVNEVRASVSIMAEPLSPPGAVRIIAPEINLNSWLHDLQQSHPLHLTITSVLDFLAIKRIQSCTVRISSTIPVSAGMGSGAAVSVALIKALTAFLGRSISEKQTCDLSFEIEKIYHKTPSGIDNSVVTYGRTIYFEKGKEIDQIVVPQPFELLICDTGIPSSTASVVGDLRSAWLEQPEKIEILFDRVGELSRKACVAIETNKIEELGGLMNENHSILVQMGVSSSELDHLVEAARRAGAFGAKLSGAGRGGNMIALINKATSEVVSQALFQEGAKRVIKTCVQARKKETNEDDR